MRTNEQTYLHKIGFNDEDRNSDIHDKICMRLCDPEVSNKMATMIIDMMKDKPKKYLHSEDWQEISHICRWFSKKEENGESELELSLEYTEMKMSPEHKIGNTIIPAKEYAHVTRSYKDFILKWKQNNLESSYGVVDQKVSVHLNGRHVYFDVVYDIRAGHTWDTERSIAITDDEINRLSKESKEKYDDNIGIAKYEMDIKFKTVIEVKNKRENVTKSIQQLDTYRNLCKGISGYGDQRFVVWDHATVFVLATMYELNDMEQKVLEQNNILWIYLNRLKSKKVIN